MRRPALLFVFAACLALHACAGTSPSPAHRPLPGFKLALKYRVDLDAALGRQQLTLAATLYAMFSHPVEVAAVQVVDRGIWVTPRDSDVRAELLPALKQAMGSAYQVHLTRGKSLLVRRTGPARKRASLALINETAAAVRERLSGVAPGCKVTIHGRKLMIHLTAAKQARPVRQLLGQRGDLSLHLVEPGTSRRAARTRFQLRVAGGHVLQRQPALSTSLVDGASIQQGNKGGENLTLLLTPSGKERLAEVAAAYGGRKLAVLLDDAVLAVAPLEDPPKSPDAISARLRGSTTEARLQRLQRILESALLYGPLPARLLEVR